MGRARRGLWLALCVIAVLCPALVSQVEALKEENDSLRWQLDAYRNEVELLKQEQGKASRDEDTTKEQQMKLLQQALQGMQKVGLEFSIARAGMGGRNAWKNTLDFSRIQTGKGEQLCCAQCC